MRQGLVSQDIAAGNASFVEVFSHEALSGALHHDLRFGPYRYWHSLHLLGRRHRVIPDRGITRDSISTAASRTNCSRLASSTFIGGRAGRNHARLTTGRMSPPGTTPTSGDVRLESEKRSKPDIEQTSPNDRV
jgi:hypothetical protein